MGESTMRVRQGVFLSITHVICENVNMNAVLRYRSHMKSRGFQLGVGLRPETNIEVGIFTF